jgi:ribosomal protein S18 acetylase RimI-like enzyme
VSRTQGWPELRQACPADHADIRDFLTGLSMQARYLRFFTGAPRTSPAMLRVLAGTADNTDAVLAVEDGMIVGHAMACDSTTGGRRVSEIGVVVTDARQGRGIGAALVRTLAARAQARGATALVMEVLAENQPVLAMIAAHWPAARHDRAGACVTISIRLPVTQAPIIREDLPRERLAAAH